MRKLFLATTIVLNIFILSCNKTGTGDVSPGVTGGSSGAGIYGGPGGSGGGNPGGTPGTMTAGEWNDIDNWNFWQTLLSHDTIKTFPGIWNFYTQNRVTVILKDAGNKLLHDAKINLICNGNTVSGRTDNFGKAELFASLFSPGFVLPGYSLTAEYLGQTFNLGAYPSSQTSVTLTIPVNKIASNVMDIMFVVDATGSMGDEINYLKTELRDVVNRAATQLPGKQLRMGSVFYRDYGDEYLTKPFAFTTSADQLNSFIAMQNANGGGDTPEAVDEALKTATQEMQWSSTALNRLLFLILDAPPHKTPEIMLRLKNAIIQAQQKGIRIIPISASGIDWETEFFLRFLSVSTNSTYVFITDHSGIGNPHHTPTVGTYQVEFLNNLMVRLIAKYGENRD